MFLAAVDFRSLFISVDIRRLYFSAGVDNKETVFLFMDTQAVDESFMEDLNNMLSSGEVSNMYKPDEFEEVGPINFNSASLCTPSWCLIVVLRAGMSLCPWFRGRQFVFQNSRT